MIKRFAVKNQYNQKIVGLLNIPKTKPPFPAVIVCHGFTGYKEQIHLQSLAEVLESKGFLVCRFDFTNEIGKSDGRIENISFKNHLSDLKTIVNYINHLNLVKKNHLGLAGHSFGGQIILHYAVKDKKIKTLADLAGVIDWQDDEIMRTAEWQDEFNQIKTNGFVKVVKSSGKIYKIKKDFYLSMFKIKTASIIKKINIPTIIVHGSKDKSVPLSQSKLCYKLLKKPKKLVIIKGAPHTWKEPRYYNQVNLAVASWFNKHL